jgi:hypothetical protein
MAKETQRSGQVGNIEDIQQTRNNTIMIVGAKFPTEDVEAA